MSRNLLCAYIGLVVCVLVRPADATTIHVGAVNGQVRGPGVFPDQSTLCLYTPGMWNPDLRNELGLLEFPLAGIPHDGTVLSVSLEINVTTVESGNSIRIRGYPADGVIDRSDLNHNFLLIGGSRWMDLPGTYSGSIDPAYVQSLLGTCTHLGLLLSSSKPYSPIVLESPLNVSPKLTVVYVPEPAGLLLLLGGVILATSRRLPRPS